MTPESLDELNAMIDAADGAGKPWAEAIPEAMDGYTLGVDQEYPGWETGRYITTAWLDGTPVYDIVTSVGTLIAVDVSERKTP